MRRFHVIILILIFSNTNCALFENFDEIPMFIEVQSVDLITNTAQGSSSHNILDIWPNADGQSLGVFEIPISFPVLDTDDQTNMIYFAGIRRVGFTEDHTIYPFYERVTIDRPFVPDSRIVDNLSFRYRDDVNFRLVEDFELSHVFTKDVDEDMETNVEVSGTGCEEGNCGLIRLTEEHPEFAAATNIEFSNIPTNGTPVYIEMDYKTDINLTIGLQALVNGTEFEQYFLSLTPNESWNKVYIDLSEILQDSDLDSYRILFGALYQGTTEAEIRIDNIKLLHF